MFSMLLSHLVDSRLEWLVGRLLACALFRRPKESQLFKFYKNISRSGF